MQNATDTFQWMRAAGQRMREQAPVFVLATGRPGGAFTRETHMHESWELKIAVTRGMKVRFPGTTVPIDGPGCCLIAPGVPHENTCPSDFAVGGRGGVICYDGGILSFGQVSKDSVVGRGQLSRAQLEAMQEDLGAAFEQLVDGLGAGLDPFGKPEVDAAATRSLVKLLDALPQTCKRPQDAVPCTPEGIVTEAEDYMCGYYFDPELTVEDVARAVGRTPNHLATLFRRHRGRTVRQSLVDIRILRAKALLANSLYSVKEVSCLTGWNSASYFSNCFAQRLGYRPSRGPHAL